MAKENIVGIDGKRNKAEVTRETLSKEDARAAEINARARDLAKIVCPVGFEYAGQATVYLFSNEADKNRPVFVFVNQVMLSNVPEGQADVAFKELKKAMMNAYGRETPAVRNV